MDSKCCTLQFVTNALQSKSVLQSQINTLTPIWLRTLSSTFPNAAKWLSHVLNNCMKLQLLPHFSNVHTCQNQTSCDASIGLHQAANGFFFFHVKKHICSRSSRPSNCWFFQSDMHRHTCPIFSHDTLESLPIYLRVVSLSGGAVYETWKRKIQLVFFPISENSLEARNSGWTWAVFPCLHERSKHYVSDLKTVSNKLAVYSIIRQFLFFTLESCWNSRRSSGLKLWHKLSAGLKTAHVRMWCQCKNVYKCCIRCFLFVCFSVDE